MNQLKFSLKFSGKIKLLVAKRSTFFYIIIIIQIYIAPKKKQNGYNTVQARGIEHWFRTTILNGHQQFMFLELTLVFKY